jgi:signal transduction histidine kinase
MQIKKTLVAAHELRTPLAVLQSKREVFKKKKSETVDRMFKMFYNVNITIGWLLLKDKLDLFV